MADLDHKSLTRKCIKKRRILSHYEIEEISATNDISAPPFDPAKIDISMRPMSLDLLIKRVKEKEIDLLTEFQRQGGLWKEVQQSRLIESILVRIPLPAFYFDGTDDNNWLVVDGLQRLVALKRFAIDKSLKLEELEFLPQFKGFSFDELPRNMQRRIEETQVVVFIINPGTPVDVKYNIFKRINTGGLTLSPQEIRHALNQGIPADFIAELAQFPEFLKATCETIKTERMEDRDFVLRFIAFNLIPYNQYKYSHDLDTFLNSAMSKISKIPPSEREFLKQRFRQGMYAAYQIFGNDSFRKRNSKQHPRKPINKALFETWAVNLGQLDNNDIKILLKQKEQVVNKFMNLMKVDSFERSVTTGTGQYNAVVERFSKVDKLIKEVLKVD